MPEYVEPGLRDLGDRDADDVVDVLLGVSGDRAEFGRRVEDLDPRIDTPEPVGRASLRVSVPVDAIASICELDGTKSVELDRHDVQTYSGSGDEQGNS